MADDITQTDASTAGADEGKTSAPSQKSKYTEAEQAAFSLKKNAERAKELGLDPAEILGVKTHIETDEADEDDKPVTVGMLRTIQKTDAQKSALQMADEIADEDVKTATKDYLQNNIVPSGDAEKDFKIAIGAASATKNKLVIDQIGKYTPPKRTASGGSVGATVEDEFVPTAEEARFMQPPYNTSKEKIIAARKRAAEKQQ